MNSMNRDNQHQSTSKESHLSNRIKLESQHIHKQMTEADFTNKIKTIHNLVRAINSLENPQFNPTLLTNLSEHQLFIILEFNSKQLANAKLVHSICLQALNIYCLALNLDCRQAALQKIAHFFVNLSASPYSSQSHFHPFKHSIKAQSQVSSIFPPTELKLHPQINHLLFSEFQWAQNSSDKNYFYSQCVELFMKWFSLLRSQQISLWKIEEILQFLKILQFIRPHLRPIKRTEVAEKVLAAIKQIISDSQHQKISLNSIYKISDLQKRLSSLYSSIHGQGLQNVLNQIYLLEISAAFNIIFSQNSTVNVKIEGIKTLQNFVKNHDINSPDEKVKHALKYIAQQRLWNLLTDKNAQFQIVVHGQSLIKMLIRSNRLDRDELNQTYQCEFFQNLFKRSNNLRDFYLRCIQGHNYTACLKGKAIEVFEQIQESSGFYSVQFMATMVRFSIDASKNHLRKIVDIIWNIYQKHRNVFQSRQFCQKAVQVFKAYFDKFFPAGYPEDEIVNTYLKLFKEFLNQPHFFISTLCKFVLEKYNNRPHLSFSKAIQLLSQTEGIVQKMFQFNKAHPNLEKQFKTLMKMTVQKIKPSQRLIALNTNLSQCFGMKEIFTQLIKGMSLENCHTLFQIMFNVLSQNQQIQVDPSCLKEIFYFANQSIIKNFHKVYRVSADPSKLLFINQIRDLLQTSSSIPILQCCAEIIANVFTCFTEEYEKRGRQNCRQLMLQESNRLSNLQNLGKNELGFLLLTKHLMYGTETHGTGKLKATNALISISTIKMIILNQISHYQSDTPKKFEISVPSNFTLFEFINNLGKQIKCHWHQIILQNESDKVIFGSQMNGRTLYELNFQQYAYLCARKNKTFSLIKEPLIIDKELNPLFVQVLRQIFYKAAQNGKMGPVEVRKFIYHVTGTWVDQTHKTIIEMIKDHADKQTGLIYENGFIQFYKKSCASFNGIEAIWKNLTVAGYRTDFSKKNQPIKPLEQKYTYRYYLKKDLNLYKILLKTVGQNKGVVSEISKQILNHLPKQKEFFFSSLGQDLDLTGKTTFQMNFIMENLKQRLDSEIRKNQSKPPIQRKVEIHKDENDLGLARGQVGGPEFQKPNNIQVANTIRIDDDLAYKSSQKSQKPEQSFQFFMMPENQSSISSFMEQESQMINQPIHSSKGSLREDMLSRKQDIKIFQLILTLQQKDKLSKQEKILKAASIHVLRGLMNFPSLTHDQIRKQNYPLDTISSILKGLSQFNLTQKQFTVIAQLAGNCILNNEFTLYEPLIGLSLYTRNLSQAHFLKITIFHPEKSVRHITLNFLLFYSIKFNFPINFFASNFKIDPNRCDDEWFLLLSFCITHNKQASNEQILDEVLNTLVRQNFEEKSENYTSTINGYLKLVQVLLHKIVNKSILNHDKIFQSLVSILEKTLINEHRATLYELLYQINPIQTLKLLLSLIKQVKPGEYVQKTKTNFVGLKNLGSTCYMNSILQQFFMIESFRKIILNFPIKKIPEETQVNGLRIVDDFMYQLQKMYVTLENSQKKFYYPKQFCLTIKDLQNRPINTSIQQDAHQFLNKLFGKIQTYCKQAEKLYQLENIFQGQTKCDIVCSECQSRISKVQYFYHLSLEVKGISDLTESFKRFTVPQRIDDYKCENCHQISSITKQTLLKKLPKVLIVNLQRIIFDLQSLKHVKIHSELKFPQTIDLQNFKHQSIKSENSAYRLKGVVIHSGTSEGGHYYSIINFGEDWYRFDDQNVTKVGFDELKALSFGGSFRGFSADKIHSINAYILFYEQIKVKEEIQGSAQTVDSLEGDSLNQELTVGIQTQTDPNHQILKSQNDGMVEQNNYNSIGKVPNINLSSNERHQKQRVSSTYEKFRNQILWQNKSLHLQTQINQPSFFDFLKKTYEAQRPHQFFKIYHDQVPFYEDWQLLSPKPNYNSLYPIYLESVKFLVQCQKLPDSVLRDTAQVFLELIVLLPKKTEEFFMVQMDQRKWSEVICTHDDPRLRQMHKVILLKFIKVYGSYFVYNFTPIDSSMAESEQKVFQSLSARRLQQILIHFIEIVSLELLNKNVYKSFHFFDFLRTILQLDQRILKLAICSPLLLYLLNSLMGSESPCAEKDQMRQDLPCDIAAVLVQCVQKIIKFRRNMVGSVLMNSQNVPEQNYPSLTEKEGKILSSVAFYRRMVKLKYDDGSLRLILACMCYNDKSLSKSISRFFLTCINDLNEVENIPSLFQNITTFLLIEDQYQVFRLECILGFAQFHTSAKLNNQVVSYGMEYSNESKVIKYCSAAWFSDEDRSKPLLELLYEKRTYQTEFQADGIKTLLQIIAPFPTILTYVLSLPPPTYLHFTYLTWIEEYIQKHLPSKHEQRLTAFKISILKIQELYQIILKKIDQLQKNPQIPVIKQIIGKNKNVQQVEFKEDENNLFQIKLFAHVTYVMENIPQQGHQNFSLPSTIFSMDSIKTYAFYFVEKSNLKACDVEIEAEKTINTMYVLSIRPLLLKFTLPDFSHQITIPKGQTTINFSYTSQKLAKYLQVEVLSEEKNEQTSKHNGTANSLADQKLRERLTSGDYLKDGISCQTCTFLNKINADKCEICDTSFY